MGRLRRKLQQNYKTATTTKRQILNLVFFILGRVLRQLSFFALELSVFKTKQLRIVLGRFLGQKTQIQNPSLRLSAQSPFNNEFIRFFHQFGSPILSKQQKKITNFLLVKNKFFLSLPVEKEIITNIRKKIVTLEFEIGETIG